MSLLVQPAGIRSMILTLAQAVERLRTEADELVVHSSDEGAEPDAQQGDIEYFS